MKQIVCITAGCMFFALMLSACRTPATQLKEEQNMGNQMIIETPVRGGSAAVSSPRVFVYKTKGDYSHLVPVLIPVHKFSLIRIRVIFLLEENSACRLF